MVNIEQLKLQVKSNQKYAVCVPRVDGRALFIQSYDTKEQLGAGYSFWKKMAEDTHLLGPLPLEILDNTGKCKILTDIL